MEVFVHLFYHEIDPGDFKIDSAYKLLGEVYEKLGMFDSAVKNIQDDRLSAPESEDKRTLKSIKFNESFVR